MVNAKRKFKMVGFRKIKSIAIRQKIYKLIKKYYKSIQKFKSMDKKGAGRL